MAPHIKSGKQEAVLACQNDLSQNGYGTHDMFQPGPWPVLDHCVISRTKTVKASVNP